MYFKSDLNFPAKRILYHKEYYGKCKNCCHRILDEITLFNLANPFMSL